MQKILAVFDTMQEIAYFDLEWEETGKLYLVDACVVSKGRSAAPLPFPSETEIPSGFQLSVNQASA